LLEDNIKELEASKDTLHELDIFGQQKSSTEHNMMVAED